MCDARLVTNMVLFVRISGRIISSLIHPPGFITHRTGGHGRANCFAINYRGGKKLFSPHLIEPGPFEVSANLLAAV